MANTRRDDRTEIDVYCVLCGSVSTARKSHARLTRRREIHARVYLLFIDFYTPGRAQGRQKKKKDVLDDVGLIENHLLDENITIKYERRHTHSTKRSFGRQEIK